MLLIGFASCSLTVVAQQSAPKPTPAFYATQFKPWLPESGELNMFGISLAVLGDLDNDGLPELAIGDAGEAFGWEKADRRGTVLVYSIGAKRFLMEASRDHDGFEFGRALSAVPDVDGDGLPDLLVGGLAWIPGGCHAAWLLSGKSLETIRVHEDSSTDSRFGECVLGVPDVDGDGRGDYLIGNPGCPHANVREGCISMYSGRTGTVLWSVRGREPLDGFGFSSARYQDFDHDGKCDVLVGISRGWAEHDGPPGYVRILSGATGAVLSSFEGPPKERDFGSAVADIGDVDGDGKDEILAGSPNWSRQAGKTAWVCSGATFETMRSAADCIDRCGVGPGDDVFGTIVAGLSDLDGDGVRDWALGDNTGDDLGASVTAFSGRTGQVLWQIRMPPISGNLGACIVGLPDINGDGIDDVAVGCATGLGLVESCRVLLLNGHTGRVLREVCKPTPAERAALRR